MKKLILSILLSSCCLVSAGEIKRRINISGAAEKISDIVIIKGDKKPLIDFAAAEMQKIIGKAVGKKTQIVSSIAPEKLTIVLGDCELSRKAGLDVSKLPEEGFYIRRVGKVVYIAGQDSDRYTPARSGFSVAYKRGTLTGAYDFLERFAGARFFFAGPVGTIVPARGAIHIPGTVDIMDSPDMFFRLFSFSERATGKYYRGYSEIKYPEDIRTIRQHILPQYRAMEKNYPFGHGLNGLDLVRRFGKSNPEYFALMDDGKRYNDPKMFHTGQLCFSSGVRDVIIQDAIAYFSGKPAKSRGMKNWSFRTVFGDIFGIMPQDGMYWCRCAKCKKVWDCKGSIADERARKAISNFMFRFYAEVCDALAKAGLKHKVATMAYLPYDIAPDFPLPKELLIQVAVTGLGSKDKKGAADTAKLKMWYDRTGNKVTAWTYAMGKHMKKVIPGVPAMMPRHAANFLKTNRKYLDGVYFESETDTFFFNYLNYYIVMKLMWDTSLDVEKLLDEHFKVMFGKGAPYMAKFYADLEDNWTRKILGNTVDTDLGPVTAVPSTRDVWTRIYSPAKLKYYASLFDQALAAVKHDKDSAARLQFVRREMLEPIMRVGKRHQELQRGMDFWIARVPGTVWLRPYSGEFNEVNTKVTLKKDNDFLIVRAECEEPRMKEISAKSTERDDLEIFRDSAFEILLNPSGDRKNYFQFGVNSNGALADGRRRVNGKLDLSWNSGAVVKAGKNSDSWWAEVKIPLKALGVIAKGGFPANFCRNRVLTSGRLAKPYYQWSIDSTGRGGFHSLDSWGKISFDPAPAALIPNGNFEKLDARRRVPVNFNYKSKPGFKFFYDDKCFISGGRSIRIECDGSKNGAIGCRIPGIKPNQKYRLSFFIKTENLVSKSGKFGAGAWIYFFRGPNSGMALPKVRITGNNPWHRVSVEFKAPADSGKDGYAPALGLWVWNARGKVWYDEVRLEELK